MRIAIATLLAALAATHASAQPSLAEVCQDADMPTRAEYDGNPTAYADNFCALATFAPNRAARQFDSMVSLVRAHNNPNRHYWDRRYAPTAEHLQLLRPWMAERNLRVRRHHPAHGSIRNSSPSHRRHVPVVVAQVTDALGGLSSAFGVLWISRSSDGQDHFSVLYLGHHAFGLGRFHPVHGGLALFALITRSGDIERINFMSSDVYWDWIARGMDGATRPTVYNITRTVHAALDCLGRDATIGEAISLSELEHIEPGTHYRDTHYSCEVLVE